MLFVTETRDGDRIEWRDTKRWLWFISIVPPLLPVLCYAAYYQTNQSVYWVWGLILFSYVLIPVLDVLLGEDSNNPPEAVVNQLADDPYYTRLLYLAVAAYFLSFAVSIAFFANAPLPFWAQLLVAINAGMVSGTSLTVGYELGHKSGRWEQIAARLINGLSWYGHFTREHNSGHHVQVATPEDSASARFNESLYAFMTREIPHGIRRGLRIERERLTKRGLPFWHWKNEILQCYAVSVLIAVICLATIGWITIPFLLVHNYFSWMQLTLANYVEHYGLKRQVRPDGKYEPCEPRHSWNTNHIFSNLLLFHLQRHSDHHANPMRPYQALRDFSELPRLPSGYPGCFVLASIPPLWFRVMNPKVLAWAGGDMAKVNTGVSAVSGAAAPRET